MTMAECFCRACVGRRAIGQAPFSGVSLCRDMHVTSEDLQDLRPRRQSEVKVPPPAPPGVSPAQMRAAIKANNDILTKVLGRVLNDLWERALVPLSKRIRAVEEAKNGIEERHEPTTVHSKPLAGWHSSLV
jgi:hypothetical protein